LAGIDEPRYGALKKASIFSGGMKYCHLGSWKHGPDLADPNRQSLALKLQPSRLPIERGSVHKGLLVMHCIFTATNGVKLYV
jgi:hypothetical protein